MEIGIFSTPPIFPFPISIFLTIPLIDVVLPHGHMGLNLLNGFNDNGDNDEERRAANGERLRPHVVLEQHRKDGEKAERE